MFQFLKKLFQRPRLIERYSSMSDILLAHNALIHKTIEVADSMPPKYLLARYKAIQDAEERAIKAYWRNKQKKQDKWCGCEIVALKAPVTAETTEKADEQVPEQITATPPLAALEGENTNQLAPKEVDAVIAPPPVEPPTDTVVEIHINK